VTTAVEFAELGEALCSQAQRLHLRAPAFRSPPTGGRVRSIAWRPTGVVVSVAIRGRSRDEVAMDMVDGVLIANGARHSDDVRRLLIAATTVETVTTVTLDEEPF